MNLRSIEKKIEAGKTLTDEEEEYLKNRIISYRDNHPDVEYRFPRWKKIMAWVAGYQWYDYSRLKKAVVPVPLEQRHRLVFNRLRSYVRTVVGKLCSVTPQLGVVPKTDEAEDVDAARAGDLVLEALAEKFKFEKLRRMAYLWLVLLNRVYIRVYWNEEDKGLVGYEEKEVEIDEIKVKSLEPIYEPGDVAMEIVPPFNCRPDPLNFEPSKWRWFIYCDKVDAETLEEKYELEEGALTTGAGETNTLDSVYTLGGYGDEDFTSSVPSTDEDTAGRTTIYTEFWTPKMFAFVAGNVLLEYGENPYGKIPFFAHEEQLIPVSNYEKGIVYNDSIIKDLIPVQRQYNKHMSIISKAIERASKVKVMSPFDSLVNKKQFYDDGGLVIIDYNEHAGRPYQLKLDNIPPFAMHFKQELEREIEMCGNVHEVSFGRLPQRASHASGALVNLLIEQDDQVLDPLIRDVDAMFSEAWSLVLKIIHDNYTRPRMLKVLGRDSIDSIIHFQGSDLNGNTDVFVTTQLGLPKSKPLRVEWILRLLQLGLVQDPKAGLEMMEFGQVKKLYADQLLHERKATRENLLIEKNPNIEPDKVELPYLLDADDIHLKIHLRDRLSPKYDHYTINQQQALENHIQQHLSRSRLAKMQSQMMAQPQVGGRQRPMPKESIPEETGLPTP